MGVTVGREKKQTIRFIKYQDNTPTFLLSPKFIDTIKLLDVNAVEFGVDIQNEYLFIRFNNENKGKGILNRKRVVSSSQLGAKVLYSSLQNLLKSFSGNVSYQVTELTSHLYVASIKEAIYSFDKNKTEEYLQTVRWLKPREYSDIDKQFINFYQSGNGLIMLHTSNDLIAKANKEDLTYMEFGINSTSGYLYIRQNSKANGVPLTSNQGEYVSKIDKVNLLFNTLKESQPKMEFSKRYEVIEVDEHVYQIDILAELNELKAKEEYNSELINWLAENQCIEEKPFISPKYNTLHFYQKLFQEEETYAIRFSPTFVKTLIHKGYKYMDFVLNTSAKSIILDLNNKGHGICLRNKNSNKEYRTAGIIATDILNKIQQTYPKFSVIQPYKAVETSANTFTIFMEKEIGK